MVTSIKGNDTSTFGGQVVTPAPLLRVYLSSTQSVSQTTSTKIAFDGITYDLTSDWDSTNKRFVPSVAGYYLFYLSLYTEGTGGAIRTFSNFFKNGVNFQAGQDQNGTDRMINNTAIIYCNGTTDYVEAYGWIYSSSTPQFYGSSTATSTTLSATLVRAV